jgi:peptide/nickel transport system permease protein
MKNHQGSPDRSIWNRFRKNYLAVFGMIVIGFSVLMAILGYWICPDSSPNANQMHIQYSIQKPGSEFTLLLIRKKKKIDSLNVFERLWWGQTPFYEEIPINSYKIIGDSIQINEFTGVVSDSLEKSRYHLVEVLYAVVGNIKKKQGNYYFSDLWRKPFKVPENEIKQQIPKNVVHRKYILGTDLYGRDLLSRLILGSRISISVGVMAVLISLFLGILLGSLAGFYRGWVDGVISWFINVVWALPALLLVIAISLSLGKGLWQIFLAVGLTMWVEVARMVRGQIFFMREAEFVEAGRAIGMSDFRLIYKHILPNISGPILVVAASNFASAILLEAGLSFLGFGAQPPFPSWGSMIKENYGYIIIDAAFLALMPGVAIMLVVYGFNLLSIGLRDAYDIRDQNTMI